MAASTSGALKALIEGLGLSISAYQDQAPPDTKKPYVTIDEAVAIVPDPLEDGAMSTGREHATVHVWMAWKDLAGTAEASGTPTGGRLQSYTLATDVARGLQGARLTVIGTKTTYCVLVRNVGPRLLEIEENIVHFPVSVEVWREI